MSISVPYHVEKLEKTEDLDILALVSGPEPNVVFLRNYLKNS